MVILLLCLSILINSCANLEFHGNNHLYDPKFELEKGTAENGGKIKFETIATKNINKSEIFNHITLRNIAYHQITFKKMNSGDKGIQSKNSDAKVTAIDSTLAHGNSLKLKELNIFGCDLIECIVGFVFYSSVGSGKAIIDNKVVDFKGVLYHKFISNDGFISFGDIYVYDNHFPLILCPYKNWINTLTLSEFKPKEGTGILFDKFYNRHILQPMFPRNPYATRFICGEIYYSSDRSSVNIGYRIKFLLNTDHKALETTNIDLLKDKLVCHKQQKEDDYYHFVHGTYNGKETQMKYLNLKSPNGVNIYNDTKIYLYNKADQQIKKLNEQGVKMGNNFISIEPVCALSVKPLSASIKLYTKDGKEVAFSSSGNNTAKKVLYVDEKIVKDVKDYKCRVVVDGTNKEYIKNFYTSTFDAQLISPQSNGDEKIIKNLTLKEDLKGFGKYSCKLIPKDGVNDRKREQNIKGLTFEMVPSGKLTTLKEELWNSTTDAMIHCDIFAYKDSKLSDMSVTLSNTSKYTNSIKADKKMFAEETTYIKFKILDYINENKTFEKINYNCIYKTADETVYSVQKKANIADPELMQSDYDDTSSDDSKGTTILIILGIILIILFVATLIASIFIMKKLRKNRNIRKQLGLGRSSSSSASSSSSFSTSKSSMSGLSGVKSNISGINSNMSGVSGSVSGLSKNTSSKMNSKVSKVSKPTPTSNVQRINFVTK
uniref:Ig-like domain-containing protein n=1 Tax=Strongyloides papillosus TaxID=174720 RepID=A0A0N5B8Y4_STREA